MMPMSSQQPTVITLGFVFIVMLAGCALGGENVKTPTQTGTPTSTPVQTTTVDSPTETAHKNQTGTVSETATETVTPPPRQQQFIFVTEVNTSLEWDEFNNTEPKYRVQFSNLSTADQQTFIKTLNSTKTKSDGLSGAKFVKYNRTWYKINHLIEWVN
jgi:hypothetical protein